MRHLIIASALLFAFASQAAEEAAAPEQPRLHFPGSGFSITPLEDEEAGEPRQVLMMFLAPRDGFASNVNVQMQPWPGSFDAYAKLSENQFKQMGWKVLDESSTEDSRQWEYTGHLQGMEMHFYSRACKRGEIVYLATGTALASNWEKDKQTLKACVDSFKLEPVAEEEPDDEDRPGMK
jgi:hypothetical protein